MAGADWEAEHAVDAVLAGALIGSQFPELRTAEVELLATGWDNTVFLVGGEWAFRFPRREIALDLFQRELAVLPAVAPRLPLAVPVPVHVGAPDPERGYPWPFWGARLVEGVELAEAGLDDDARGPAARAAGEFLRALHDTRVTAELPVDPMRRAQPAVRAGMARERLAALAARRLWHDDGRVAALLADGEGLGPPGGEPVLQHGDLHVRHLLLDPTGRASGVIDWGDTCLADPAVDLSLAYGGFAGRVRAALLDAYGGVDAERELRARVLAVSICAALADYAAAEGRDRLLAESLRGITRAASGDTA